MRLIDADALKAEWYRLSDINNEDCGARFVGYQEIARLINNAPTVQPTGDYISRADAIEAIMKHHDGELNQINYGLTLAKNEIQALPSAENSNTKTQNLNQETQKSNGDLIYRADAIELLTKIVFDEPPYLDSESLCRIYAKEQINTLPSAELAEAVQGEWEHWGSPFSDESEVIDTIVCSVCGARFIEPKDEPKGEYNFCPNCGAKMKGGDAK